MPVVVSSIAAALGSGLVSGVGQAIGAGIINSIFGDGSPPSYFTEVYKEIERIVHQEVTQNTINEIDGQIHGLTTWIMNVYNPRKESGASKEELFEMIAEKESDIAINMIGVLQQESYAESALSVFVIGASLHLVLLQECALVDPNKEDPTESSYAVSVQKYARQYADYAVDKYNLIARKRTSGDVIYLLEACSPGMFPPYFEICIVFGFEDKFAGYRDEDSGTLAAFAMNKYIKNIKKKLNTDLNDPLGVSDNWDDLIDQPLPQQEDQ